MSIYTTVNVKGSMAIIKSIAFVHEKVIDLGPIGKVYSNKIFQSLTEEMFSDFRLPISLNNYKHNQRWDRAQQIPGCR